MVEIRIDGPGKNALGTTRMAELLGAVEAAGEQPLWFVGAGDAFSAGLDLKEVYQADTKAMQTFLVLLTRLLSKVLHHPAPTVAAINGHAIAGGYLLAFVCDHRVMTTNPRARVGLNEVALGLRFPPGILGMLRARLPPNHLHEVLLGAGLHGPKHARALGLVDELDDTPIERAQQVLTALSAHPRQAYAAAKRSLNDGVDTVDSAAQERFVAEVLPTWSSPELKARIGAFMGLR